MPPPEADKLVRDLVAAHGDTPETRRLAEVAAGCWQRAQEAGARVEAEGLTISTPKGTFTHPCVVIERNARIAFLMTIRALRQRPVRTKIGRPPLTDYHLEAAAQRRAAPSRRASRYITPLGGRRRGVGGPGDATPQ